jgi:hypothetical protein
MWFAFTPHHQNMPEKSSHGSSTHILGRNIRKKAMKLADVFCLVSLFGYLCLRTMNVAVCGFYTIFWQLPLLVSHLNTSLFVTPAFWTALPAPALNCVTWRVNKTTNFRLIGPLAQTCPSNTNPAIFITRLSSITPHMPFFSPHTLFFLKRDQHLHTLHTLYT